MKAKTGVILVLLAAFVYVAAQEGESEQNVVEELLVETLVSSVCFCQSSDKKVATLARAEYNNALQHSDQIQTM